MILEYNAGFTAAMAGMVEAPGTWEVCLQVGGYSGSLHDREKLVVIDMSWMLCSLVTFHAKLEASMHLAESSCADALSDSLCCDLQCCYSGSPLLRASCKHAMATPSGWHCAGAIILKKGCL